jgi:hypothetical protein
MYAYSFAGDPVMRMVRLFNVVEHIYEVQQGVSHISIHGSSPVKVGIKKARV